MKKIVLTALVATIISWCIALLAEQMGAPIPVIGTYAGFLLSHNRGIAFGINIPSPFEEILISSALIAVLFVARHAKDTLTQIAFGLIIGGAIANLIDRAMDGRVTDYIAIGTFPIFNMADTCISIGAGLLIVESLVRKNVERRV